MSATLPVFCSSPSPKRNEDYISWLNKIETQKSQTWKDRGIYDLVQLSRVAYPYYQNMLFVALYFCESSTNTFQLPCGIITLTLFDVTTIIGLHPTGDSFNPTERDEDAINFNINCASFGKYTEDHHDTTTVKVSDE